MSLKWFELSLFAFVCMAPKKITTSKKQKFVVGTSSIPIHKPMNYNIDMFLRPEQEDMYVELSNGSIWMEHTFRIDPESDFRNCAEINT